MVKLRLPIDGIVAVNAIRSEVRRTVIRIDRLLVVRQVARRASDCQSVKHTAGVAAHAICSDVRTRQGEITQTVVENGIRPFGRNVTHLAVGRITGRCVIRIACIVVVCRVATDTFRRRILIWT